MKVSSAMQLLVESQAAGRGLAPRCGAWTGSQPQRRRRHGDPACDTRPWKRIQRPLRCTRQTSAPNSYAQRSSEQRRPCRFIGQATWRLVVNARTAALVRWRAGRIDHRRHCARGHIRTRHKCGFRDLVAIPAVGRPGRRGCRGRTNANGTTDDIGRFHHLSAAATTSHNGGRTP